MTRRAALVGMALFASSGLLVTGWVTWSGRIAGDVAVTWSSGSPTCEGTVVEEAGSQRPVMEAVEPMRCVITVEVENGSARTVHVAHAVAPWVGPRTGTVVTAENAKSAAKHGGNDIDALVTLDLDLEAGESTEFDVVLVFNPAGCNDSGTFSASSWPTVTVEVLGRSFDLHGNKDFVFHRDGTTPGCQQP